MASSPLVEIVEEPIDPQRYTDAVRSTKAGAIATFAGTTRDTFEGKQVLELRYEAYIPMAKLELEKICKTAQEQWDLIAVAVAHRIGIVPVGQESVFVAASSVHRKDALAACQFLIDQVKASVPIWKKEVYEGGSDSWKENSEFHSLKKTSCCCTKSLRNA